MVPDGLTSALKASLIFLLFSLVLAQIYAVALIFEYGNQFDEVKPLVIPYSIGAVLALVGVQASVIIVWQLLSMIEQNTIFQDKSIRRVNQLIACLSASIIIVAGLLAYLFLVVQIGGPPLLMMFVLVIPLGAAVILLLLVMRGLLVEAVRNRSELDSVI